MSSSQNTNQGESLISKAWKPIYRRWWFWVFEVPFLLFVALLILRAPFFFRNEKSKEVVVQIHAQKLTLADVDGKHLPPTPDPAQVDATIEGVDANANGIRDDVELAIFKKYPNSAKIRAAELQYAKALHLQFTLVSSPGIFAEADREGVRARGCFAISQISSDATEKYMQEVSFLEFNNADRINKKYSNFQYNGPYTIDDVVPECDVDVTLF